MDIYHIWCDPKPGIGDLDIQQQVAAYLGHLQDQKVIEARRLTRRKLGLGPPTHGEFHVMIEARNLAQLDAAFNRVASRRDPVEGFHFNSLVQNAVFALYRDFPDPVSHQGEERF
jgi:hypothetical protein